MSSKNRPMFLLSPHDSKVIVFHLLEIVFNVLELDGAFLISWLDCLKGFHFGK